MTSNPTRDLALVNAAGFLRSFGVGLMGVVLGIYLFRTGLMSLGIGLVIAIGLAGSALATMLVSLFADRVGRRSFLLILSLLSGVAGIALAVSPSLPVLAILAFVGMLNGTGTDRSAASALDQAIIPELVSDIKRTWTWLGTTSFLTAEGRWERWRPLCQFFFNANCRFRCYIPTGWYSLAISGCACRWLLYTFFSPQQSKFLIRLGSCRP